VRTKVGAFAIFSLIFLMIVPVHADVDKATIDKEAFSVDDKFTISGTTSDADRVMLIASMKGPNGEKLTKNVLSDPGTFTFIPIDPGLLFKSKGEYTIRVFTEYQRVENATSIELLYENGIISLVPDYILELKKIGNKQVVETEKMTFTASVSDSGIDDEIFSLSKQPNGATINKDTGIFSWTPTSSQVGGHIFDIIVKSGPLEDKETITVTVSDKPEPKATTPEPKDTEPKATTPEPAEPKTDEPKELGIASFVDETKDPQYYVDRYTNEATYKKWFDDNFSEYDSIYQAVGIEEEEIEEEEFGECGEGTDLVNGMCVIVDDSNGGGCLIATATYGSEMAPQVQLLREIRDNQLMNTDSGVSFMSGFNQLYYSFSPIIADMERENPAFKEMVKIGITPMLSTLSIMSYAESESEVFGYGIGVILMNLGMYVAVPAIVVFKTRKYIKI
jgi:hypothetical protein